MADVSTSEDINLPADTAWSVHRRFRRHSQMGGVGES